MSLSDQFMKHKAGGLPETFFKALMFFVVLYTGFIFYIEERYIVATVVFSFLFVLVWGLLDSEIF